MRAASDCEIQSSGVTSDKLVDIDNLFMLGSKYDRTVALLTGKESAVKPYMNLFGGGGGGG